MRMMGDEDDADGDAMVMGKGMGHDKKREDADEHGEETGRR